MRLLNCGSVTITRIISYEWKIMLMQWMNFLRHSLNVISLFFAFICSFMACYLFTKFMSYQQSEKFIHNVCFRRNRQKNGAISWEYMYSVKLIKTEWVFVYRKYLHRTMRTNRFNSHLFFYWFDYISHCLANWWSCSFAVWTLQNIRNLRYSSHFRRSCDISTIY